MAGDASNAAIWSNADVYIDLARTATAPTDVTTTWGTGWEAVGLLNGEEGFTQEREEEIENHYAWGGLLIKTSRSQHTRTIQFVALEDNDTMFAILNPGSTREPDAVNPDLIVSTVKVPTNQEFSIGFEMRDGTKTKRRICKRAAVTEVDEIVENETEVTAYTVTVTLYPEADSTLYTELEGLTA